MASKVGLGGRHGNGNGRRDEPSMREHGHASQPLATSSRPSIYPYRIHTSNSQSCTEADNDNDNARRDHFHLNTHCGTARDTGTLH